MTTLQERAQQWLGEQRLAAKYYKKSLTQLLAQVEAQARLELIKWVIDVIRSHDENFLDKFQEKRAELLALQAGAEGEGDGVR